MLSFVVLKSSIIQIQNFAYYTDCHSKNFGYNNFKRILFSEIRTVLVHFLHLIHKESSIELVWAWLQIEAQFVGWMNGEPEAKLMGQIGGLGLQRGKGPVG